MLSRKPEWAPPDAGSEFASKVVSGASPTASNELGSSKPKISRHYDLAALVEGVKASNRTILSKAITMIESNSPKHFELGQELLKQLLPDSGKSVRIGITGVPGAGKSTFIESFGLWLIEQGKKVAVLAIDPSSSISKGSILGDKTRMELLSRKQESFIRPSPSSGVLGGVARKTRETIILCEAAGYDVILIETVGVGQSETAVRSMVDFFLLMQIAGAGDELQGIKKGIIEIADLIVVNKADGDNVQRAEATKQDYLNVLHYLRNSTPGWQTRALTCSSLTGEGIKEIWEEIISFIKTTEDNGYFDARRTMQNTEWFEALIKESVLHQFYQQTNIKKALPELKQKVADSIIPVALAVKELLSKHS